MEEKILAIKNGVLKKYQGVESIGFMAFCGCPLLKRPEAPASVTCFGGGFHHCTGLEEVAVLGKAGVSDKETDYGK